MGAFAQWQPRYAEYGIATFPVRITDEGKKPVVKGYLKTGPSLSLQYARKFPDVEAFGFACGKPSRITILDIDTPNESVLSDAFNRHGLSPFVVRSGSGNFQAWYRHGGEGRRIRPWGPDRPIDILGAGYVVAPPSLGTRRRYEIIQGGLQDIAHLPKLHGLQLPSDDPKPVASAQQKATGAILEGRRNTTLWRACMREARRFERFDDILNYARTTNAGFLPPLPDHEVLAVAKSAWKKTEDGTNWFGGHVRMVALSHAAVDELAAADPDALALLMILRRWHWDKPQFILAKAMAGCMHWSIPRFKAARSQLEVCGYIELIHRGGKGKNDPPIYRLKNDLGVRFRTPIDN